MNRFQISIKRSLVTVVAILMLATSVPLPLLAEMPVSVDYEHIDKELSKILNADAVFIPAEFAEDPKNPGEANRQIQNPPTPETYTYEIDYLVPREGRQDSAYQPYIATVGESASAEEKSKISKVITFPDLLGYRKPRVRQKIDYNSIIKKAKDQPKPGLTHYRKVDSYLYEPNLVMITVRHRFESLDNPGTFDDKKDIYSPMRGKVGDIQPVPLFIGDELNGYQPESTEISVRMPDQVGAKGFTVERRYYRKSYDVVYNSDGGTDIPAKRLYYGQKIPKLEEDPSKRGASLKGWVADQDLIYRDAGKDTTLPKGTPIEKDKIKSNNLIMPDTDVTFTAQWKDQEKANYTIQFWTQKAESGDYDENKLGPDGYDFAGATVVKDAEPGTAPDLDQVRPENVQFPDIPSDILEKIRGGEWDLLEKYYGRNEKKTEKENLVDPNETDETKKVIKKVRPDGETVYNIYYDRREYTLLFEKSPAILDVWENIGFESKMHVPTSNENEPFKNYDSTKAVNKPYETTAKFGERIKGWPNDFWLIDKNDGVAFPESTSFLGWNRNTEDQVSGDWPAEEYIDTPPYWLSSKDFIDRRRGGLPDEDLIIPVTKSTSTGKTLPKYTMSFGPTVSAENQFAIFYLEYIFQGMEDEETDSSYHFDPDMSYVKIDTSVEYTYPAPYIPGFESEAPTDEYDVQGISIKDIEHNKWAYSLKGSTESELHISLDEVSKKNPKGEESKNPEGKVTYRPYNERSFFTAPPLQKNEINGVPFKDIEKYHLTFPYKRLKYNIFLDTNPYTIDDSKELESKTLSDGSSVKIAGIYYQKPLRKVDKLDQFAAKLTDQDRPENLPDSYVFKGWSMDPEGNTMIKDSSKNNEAKRLEGEIDKKYKELSDNYDQMTELYNAIKELEERKTTTKEEMESVTTEIKETQKKIGPLTSKDKQLHDELSQLKAELQVADLTMPNHDIVLYAIWGEPDLEWTITFDLDGGTFNTIQTVRTIEPLNLATHKEGDSIVTSMGKAKYSVPQKMSPSADGPQIFSVKHRMTIYEPNEPIKEDQPNQPDDPFYFIRPTKDGYDFGGWEVIHKKPDGSIDTDYVEQFGVRELYAFGNEVVTDVYLKAIWIKNDLVTVQVKNHMLDEDLKHEVVLSGEPLVPQRVGQLVYTTGTEQGKEVLLVPLYELQEKEVQNYEKYLEVTGRSNSFYQNLRIMSEEEIEKAKKENPSLTDDFINTFHYFYRPFRKRHYRVNYLGIKDPSKESENSLLSIADHSKLPKDSNYSHILEPEEVTNGNRDYDARNYRPLPGWKLESANQVQLIFDLDKDGNIQGINGVPSKEGVLPQVNFYYQDVRVIHRKGKESATPTGYCRITFKADEGGSFGTDNEGNEIKELYYDVIEGLEFRNFNKLVPATPDQTGAPSDAKKIQVQPGYQFKAWDDSPLLDPYTMIRRDYTFTAKFTKLEVPKAKEIVVFESWKDGNDWGNDFLPTNEQYDDAMAVFKPEEFTGYTLKDTDASIYEKLKEEGGAPSDQPPRHESIAAEIAWNGGSSFPVQIPVKVFKNIYRALDDANMPSVVRDNPILKEKFVKVVVDPTNLAIDKQKKTYYVNPDAKVLIPNETPKPIPGYVFKGWRYKDANQDEQSIDLAQRHQIKAERTIYAVFEKESEFSATEITVPESFRDGDTWVNSFLPSEDDLKDALSHKGPDGQSASLPADAKVEFGEGDASSWKAYKSLEDSLYNKLKEKENPDDKSSRTEYVTAKITTGSKVAYVEIPIKVIKNIYEGKTLEDKPEYVPEDYVKVILDPTQHAKLPQKTVFYVNPEAKVLIPGEDPEGIDPYSFDAWRLGKDGAGEKHTLDTRRQFKDELTYIKATYGSPEIISYDPQDPEVRPTGYWRVTFEHDSGLRFANNPKPQAYLVRHDAGKKLGDPDLVKPSVEALIGYSFEKWDKEDELVIQSDLIVTAKSKAIPDYLKKDKDTPKPDGYVEVVFVAGEHGTVPKTSYFVNPTKYLTLDPPATTPDTGYVFSSWDKDPRIPTQYTKPITTITASFVPIGAIQTEETPGYVKVSFEIEGDGGSIVDGEVVTYYVDPNQKVTLPDPHVIEETGYKFEGWKPNPKTPTTYTEPTTIKGTFGPLDPIIPIENPEKPEVSKPDGYVQVTFVPGTGGSLEGTKLYYVNPKAGKTLRDLAHPTIKPFTGYQANGWDKASDTPITSDLTVTAQYAPYDEVIEKTKEDDSEKPQGYIKVIFDTTEKGIIDGTNPEKTEKIVFVNPHKPVILKDFAPKVAPKTGNEFARWDVDLQKLTVYQDGDRIQALYNTLDNIKTEETPGYVKVIFKQGDHGTLLKTVGGTPVARIPYWIKPGVKITLPAPLVKPNTGYRFDQWDKDLEVKAKEGDKPIEITAQYQEYPNVMPGPGFKPEGYVEVTFKPKDHGELFGTTLYYVNPEKTVDLTPRADAIYKKPDIGYQPGSWDKQIPSNQQITVNTEYTFHFEPLADVIKEEEGKTKPDGYVTVTFIPTDKATDKTKARSSYWVNPEKEVSITPGDPDGRKEDNNGISWTYHFIRWSTSRGGTASWDKKEGDPTLVKGTFTQDTEITAQYSTSLDQQPLLPPPIPKEGVTTPIGVRPEAKELIENIPGSTTPKPLPDGTQFSYVPGGEPNVEKPGEVPAKVRVTYPNGKTVDVDVTITVVAQEAPTARALYVPVAGKLPTVEDYKTVLDLPKEATLQSVSILTNPDLSRVGQVAAKIKVTYTNGQTFEVDVPVIVFGDVIEQEHGDSIPDLGN